MKQYDVVALGELLIDFTETGMSPQGNPLLEALPISETGPEAFLHVPAHS